MKKSYLGTVKKSVVALAVLSTCTAAMARGEHDQQNPTDRNRLEQNRPSQNLVIEENNNWARGYIGRLSFDLQDDQGLREKTVRVKELKATLDNVEKNLKAKKAALAQAEKSAEELSKKIGQTQKTLNKNTENISKLQKSIPTLEKSLKEAQDALKLAQASEKLTKEDMDKVATRLVKKNEELATAQNNCQAAPNTECEKEIQKIKRQVAKLEKTLSEKSTVHDLALADLNKKQAITDAARNKLTSAKKMIRKLQADNGKLIAQLNEQKESLKVSKKKVVTAKQQLKPVQVKFNRANKMFADARDNRNDYRAKLIRRILAVNSDGANQGMRNGLDDGQFYAGYIGVDFGQRDGDRDGVDEGTREGHRREDERGYNQGYAEGTANAEADGEKNGTYDGTIAGNKIAATNDGIDAGTRRAEGSDASEVGTAQGKTDGMGRAVREGKVDGYAIGKKQGIELFEMANLNSVNVDGQFSGSFAAVVPSYPGFNCENNHSYSNNICPDFNPRQMAHRLKRAVVRRAFVDGYKERYRQARKRQFVHLISDIYMNAYNETYDSAFEYYATQQYPVVFENGRIRGSDQAYNALYPQVYSEYFAKYKDIFATNPNRESNEYKQTFASVEQNTYGQVYEEIRSKFYNQYEQSTFDANIAEQIEIYRKERFAQVKDIYEKNPVLKYQSSTIADGGISGIAKNDGIYQPGETVLHSVTVTNFGKVAATAAEVKLSDGATVKLPAIPAQSSVTIKGAAKSQVPANHRLNSTKRFTLSVTSPLTAEKAIQGRHYCSILSQEVNCSDAKSVKVQYPVQLSALATHSQLILGQKNGLKLQLSNISKRSYEGPLAVTLSENAGSNIITKGFDQLDSLGRSQSLSDAVVMVKSESDIYTPIAFSAVLKKNGVTLGVVDSTFQTMVKAPFINRAGQSVLVVNSDKSAMNLLRMIDKFDSVSNVGILDLSLGSMNAKTLEEGLKSKKVVLVDAAAVNGLNQLLKQSENSIFFTTTPGAFNQAKKSRAMKDAYEMPVVLSGLEQNQIMAFSNAPRANLKTTNMVTRMSDDNLKEKLEQFNAFTLSDDQFLSELNKLGNDNFFKSNSVVKAFKLKTLGQLMTINKAYKESGREDRFADMIKGGHNLLFHKVLDRAGDKADKKKKGIQMAAITLNKNFRKLEREFTPISDEISFKISNRVRDRLNDTMGATIFWAKKKLLKSFKKMDKSMYKKLDKNENNNLSLDLKTFFDRDSDPNSHF